MTDFPQWQKDSIKKLLHELEDLDKEAGELLKKRLTNNINDALDMFKFHINKSQEYRKIATENYIKLTMLTGKVVEDV